MLTAAGLEVALNRYLHLTPDALPKLRPLAGQVIAIELSGLAFSLYLLPDSTGIQVVDHYADEPDVWIRGTPLALLALLRGESINTAGVEMRGDTQLALDLRKLLAEIQPDGEELLSRWLGDLPAHQLSRLASGTLAWGQQSLDTLSKDIAEYLQHETRDLPPRRSIERFMDAVDTLRDDTERLQARIRRLQQDLNR